MRSACCIVTTDPEPAAVDTIARSPGGGERKGVEVWL